MYTRRSPRRCGAVLQGLMAAMVKPSKTTTAAAVCAIVACMLSPALAATGADSQFPARPMRIIVPTAPGGTVDFVARLVAESLGNRWDQNVVVDNRAGANGLIGLEIAARAAPDGHTLTLLNAGFLLSAQVSGKLSFDRGGDFTPLARFAISPLVLVMYPGVPAKNVKELVEFARAKPRYLNYASGGTGAVSHLGLALFASIAGIELTHVPYKGLGPAFSDLFSGRVHLTLTGPKSVTPHMKAGRLRGLAVTGAKRVSTLSEVPTFAEAGYPRYDTSAWYGAFAPARLPAPVVARLNADFNWVVQQPEVVDRLTGAGIDPAGGLAPAQFADYVANDLVTWKEALKAAGIQ